MNVEYRDGDHILEFMGPWDGDRGMDLVGGMASGWGDGAIVFCRPPESDNQ